MKIMNRRRRHQQMTMAESRRRFPDVWEAAGWSDTVPTDASDDDTQQHMIEDERYRIPVMAH
jgi:hypothetical protein